MDKKADHITRGDIFFADLDPVTGSEQGGTRPVLVVQNNVGNRFSPTVTILPITSVNKKKMPTHVEISTDDRLEQTSTVIAEHPKTIDKSRFGEYITSLDDTQMDKVDTAMRIQLAIPASLPSRNKNSDVMLLDLCPKCASFYYNSPSYNIRRTSYLQRVKETCTYCQVRTGYEYIVFKNRKQ